MGWEEENFNLPHKIDTPEPSDRTIFDITAWLGYVRDMIETFKIIRNIKVYDEETVSKLTPSSIEYTRGHQQKLLKKSVRYDLHWLPVQHRITYKLCLLMHLVHNNRAPSHLVNSVTATASLSYRGRLRSASSQRYE